jgi:hypothetical protein
MWWCACETKAGRLFVQCFWGDCGFVREVIFDLTLNEDRCSWYLVRESAEVFACEHVPLSVLV